MLKSRRSKLAGIGAAAALALGASTLTAPAPAQAYPWSPTVTLSGSVKVLYHRGIQSVYLSGSNGERGWATRSTGATSGSYSFTFNRVPTSTMTVYYTVYTATGGTMTGSFGLNRPSTSGSATRNICDFSPCI